MKTNALIDASLLIAIKSANEYLRVHNLNASYDTLTACIRSWLPIKIEEGLRDAKEAFACGMAQAGEATFRLSVAQAGIEAAKECGMPSKELWNELNSRV